MKALLKELAKELTTEFGRGFSRANLQNMRRFYLTYADRFVEKCQMPSDKFVLPQKSQTASGKSADGALPQIWQTPSAGFTSPFNLSWSQYVFLISINNPDERSFYETEAAARGKPCRNWTKRGLPLFPSGYRHPS